MDYSVFRFTLNMHSHRSQAMVTAFRGDTAIKLEITITDGGIPYTIADGCIATLSGTKPDGTKLWNKCTIENNKILYEFTEGTTSCVGITNCEVTLYSPEGEQLTAPKFIIVVDEREVSGGSIDFSDDEKYAIDNVLKAVQIINSSGGVEWDEELSDDSLAPVQNKVIKAALDKKLDITSVDSELSNESVNPVQNKVVKDELGKKVDKTSVDSELSAVSDNPVQNKAITTEINNHEKRITNIERHISREYFITETSTAYEIEVPTNVCPYAEINKIGSASTTKVTSLNNVAKITIATIDCGNAIIVDDSTVTFKIDANSTGYGSIYFTGLKEDGIYNIQLYGDTPSGFYSNVWYSYYDENGDTIEEDYSYDGIVNTSGCYTHSIYIEVGVDTEFDEDTTFTVQLMVNKGAAALPFEPYTEEVILSPTTALESIGANLLPIATRKSHTDNGITYTVKEDGTIIANGYASATSTFEILRGGVGEKFTLKQGETYTLSGCPKHTSATLTVQDLSYAQNYNDKNASGATAEANYTDYYAFIRLSKGCIARDLVFKPMLNRGSVAIPYSKFGATIDAFNVPEEIQAIDGYGEANPYNSTEYNYLDCDAKEHIAVGHIVDGKWIKYDEPIVTDVSAYLTDTYLEVEGGTIKAINKNSNKIPTTISYLTKEGSV